MPRPLDLIGLSASATGSVACEQVRIEADEVLFGPLPQVMQAGAGGGTGGLQTSTLALGLSRAALDLVADEARRREPLQPISETFERRWEGAVEHLLGAAREPGSRDLAEIRREANDLVLQSTQAALAAAKGTGYVAGHGAGKWAVEALFFLVWSCPFGVIQSHLCDWSAAPTIVND